MSYDLTIPLEEEHFLIPSMDREAVFSRYRYSSSPTAACVTLAVHQESKDEAAGVALKQTFLSSVPILDLYRYISEITGTSEVETLDWRNLLYRITPVPELKERISPEIVQDPSGVFIFPSNGEVPMGVLLNRTLPYHEDLSTLFSHWDSVKRYGISSTYIQCSIHEFNLSQDDYYNEEIYSSILNFL